jgi:hypothetical protein
VDLLLVLGDKISLSDWTERREVEIADVTNEKRMRPELNSNQRESKKLLGSLKHANSCQSLKCTSLFKYLYLHFDSMHMKVIHVFLSLYRSAILLASFRN